MILEILGMLLGNNKEAELERENFISELKKIPQRQEEAKVYAKYYAEHPDTEFGQLAALMAKYRMTQPYASWDWDRMREVAEFTVPLVELMQKVDPEAEISSSLDVLDECDAVISIKSGKYNEWSFFDEQMPELRKILAGTDTFSIAPLDGEQLEATFVFKGVRKTEE